MQHRYVGDRNDFIKYALLRRVRTALGEPSLGVNWYLTDPEKVDRDAGLSDGQQVDYLLSNGDRGWRREADRELFDRLRQLLVRDGQIDDAARSIDTIQKSCLLGENAIYFAREVPGPRERQSWHREAINALCDADAVFLDPDNSPSESYNQPDRGRKWAAPAEVLDYAPNERPVICISHPPHKPRRQHHNEIMAAFGSPDGFSCSAYFGSCGFHLLAPGRGKVASAIHALVQEHNKNGWGTCRYCDSEGRAENMGDAGPDLLPTLKGIVKGLQRHTTSPSATAPQSVPGGVGSRQEMTVKHALFKLSVDHPPDPIDEIAWHTENCKVHGYTDVACTKMPAGMIQACSRVGYYGDAKLNLVFLGGGIFWELLDLDEKAGQEALATSSLYAAQGKPKTTKCLLRLVDFQQAPDGATVDGLSGVRMKGGRFVKLEQETLPKGNAGNYINYWVHDEPSRPQSTTVAGEAAEISSVEIEKYRNLLEQRETELRELQRKNRTKLRDVRRPMVCALFTALRVFKPVDDTIDFIAESVTDQRSLCQRFGELRATGQVASGESYGHKWFGVHFSTGRDNQGRLYFRRRHDQGFDVLVSHKKRQDKDLQRSLR